MRMDNAVIVVDKHTFLFHVFGMCGMILRRATATSTYKDEDLLPHSVNLHMRKHLNNSSIETVERTQ